MDGGDRDRGKTYRGHEHAEHAAQTETSHARHACLCVAGFHRVLEPFHVGVCRVEFAGPRGDGSLCIHGEVVGRGIVGRAQMVRVA